MEPFSGREGEAGYLFLGFGELLQPFEQQVQFAQRERGPAEPDFLFDFIFPQLERQVQSLHERASQPELQGQFLHLHPA